MARWSNNLEELIYEIEHITSSLADFANEGIEQFSEGTIPYTIIKNRLSSELNHLDRVLDDLKAYNNNRTPHKLEETKITTKILYL